MRKNLAGIFKHKPTDRNTFVVFLAYRYGEWLNNLRHKGIHDLVLVREMTPEEIKEEEGLKRFHGYKYETYEGFIKDEIAYGISDEIINKYKELFKVSDINQITIFDKEAKIEA